MARSAHIDILLVEDDPDDAELALGALARDGVGAKVLHVTDGAAAVDYLHARGAFAGRELAELPRMVLLDLKLPKLDGFDVLERIRACARTRNLPVVILTSSNEERDKRRGYDLGANGYVVKPVDFDEYNSAVAAIGRFWLHVNRPAPRS
jgi:two-component system response regulator